MMEVTYGFSSSNPDGVLPLECMTVIVTGRAVRPRSTVWANPAVLARRSSRPGDVRIDSSSSAKATRGSMLFSTMSQTQKVERNCLNVQTLRQAASTFSSITPV